MVKAINNGKLAKPIDYIHMTKLTIKEKQNNAQEFLLHTSLNISN
jgi:hypothetical protein